MSDYYIIEKDGKVSQATLLDWAEWFETADRKIARDQTPHGAVSTVFLGANHQYGDGNPLIFETMVFGGPWSGETDRYSTLEEAKAGHSAMLEKIKYIPPKGEE